MDTNPIFTLSEDYAAGKIIEKVPDVTGSDVLTYFDFDTEGADFVTSVSTANGQRINALVIDPLTDDKRSLISCKIPVKVNANMAVLEASMNQRPRHQFAVMEMSSNEVVPVYTDYTISTIQQATTTLTLTMATSVLDEWTIGDWIHISGCLDNRLNYPNFCISTISANGLTVQGNVSDETTIPSLTVGPFSDVGMSARKRRQLLGQDGYGMRLSGTSATSAVYLSKFGANITKASGTLVGSQLATCASTAPIFTSGATGQVDIRATSRYYLRSDVEELFFGDKAIDVNTVTSTRNIFTGVKPAWQNSVYMKFSAVSPKSMSRPIAKIVSITKTASTTATVTTDAPHGLTALKSYCTIKGVRDQTNFPNLTTATIVASTPTATSFTIVIGPSATATSYGGAVILANGQIDQPGIIAQVAQSLTSDATNQLVTIVGNATWAGLNIGEYVTLYGFRDIATGANLGYDGAWEVVTLSTTTLVVKPVFNYLGTRISPTFTTLGTTNCGGAVILMTTLRSHDIGLREYSPSVTQIDGQGTTDVTKSVPIYANGGSLGVYSSTTIATTGTGGVHVRAGVVGIADVASAAITTTATTSSFANDLGNSFQITIPVTAVTGTSPTMDVRIEESFDGGTNWVTLYDLDRITGIGPKNSPILRATGRNVRYVQTIGGTSPSFTRSITRNILPFHNAEPQKRLFDRTIAVNTLNATSAVLFSGAANNVQLTVNMGAITTTAPQFQLEGSESGVATEFYPIGSPLTAVANSTIELAVNKSVTFFRVRVSTAGVGATLGYLCLKSYS